MASYKTRILITRNMAYKAIFCLLLMNILQTAHSAYCPATCDCQFDNKAIENAATCRNNDTIMHMDWQTGRKTQYRPELTITCKGTKGFSCYDTPKFDVDYFRLKVKSCPSSLLKCVNQLPRATIEKVETENIFGGYIEETFAGLEGAREYRLSLRDDDIEFPKAATSILKSLDELYITGGHFELPPNTFNDLQSLEVMELQNTKISVLHANSFNGLKCKKLNIIRNNDIESISAGTFQVIDNLHELQLSENNGLKRVETGAFKSTTLTHLLLQKNSIEYFPDKFLSNIPKFEELKILSNRADIMLGSHVFAEISPSVKWIELYDVKLHNLTDTTFLGATNLQTLKMHETKIETFPPKIFWDLISLTLLNLSGNRLKYVPAEVFSRLVKLESLNMNANRLIMLSLNQFSFSPNLKTLLISHNSITTINMTSFNGTHLQKLTLLNNGLETINGSTTHYWRDMNILDLGRNKLRTFENIIYGLTKLVEVDLSRNKITGIRENKTFFLSTKTSLDLRRNKISHVIRDHDFVKAGIEKGNFVLHLSNNPLKCDCLLVTAMSEWNKLGFLSRFEDITCSNDQFVSTINPFLFCNQKHALIALIGSSVVGSLIVLIILVSLFANRKKIWSRIMDAFEREKTSNSESIEMSIEEVTPYDVFISFAHQDEEFVTDQLIATLENDFGLKVCVHYRDWVVGDLIANQIKESVVNSKMTVIIMTEHFLESEWSYLEFRTAHDLSIEDGKPRVILVLLNEEITRDERISPDLKLYISINTYLLWNDPKFWHKLKKVLPKPQKRMLLTTKEK